MTHQSHFSSSRLDQNLRVNLDSSPSFTPHIHFFKQIVSSKYKCSPFGGGSAPSCGVSLRSERHPDSLWDSVFLSEPSSPLSSMSPAQQAPFLFFKHSKSIPTSKHLSSGYLCLELSRLGLPHHSKNTSFFLGRCSVFLISYLKHVTTVPPLYPIAL